MNIKTAFLLTLSVIISAISFSQDKQLSLEDASYMNRDLFPQSLRNLQWRGESDFFAYVKKDALVSGKAGSIKRDTLLKLDDVNKELQIFELKPLKSFPRITWIEKDKFFFSNSHKLFLFSIKDRYLQEVNNYADNAENIEYDLSNFNVAYTVDNNLFLAKRGKQLQITNDDDPGIVNGQTVHRVEFGINKGIFWSPEANYLAFYRKDETMVSDYPMVDITQRIAEVENIKYPMAGMASHEVTLGVYDISNGTTVFMKTGEPKDQYLTSIAWDPGEEYIYIALLNRDQDHLKLNKYDVKTGALVHTLFEEIHDKYVEPEHPLYFLNDHPGRFIWFSERDGYDHLYLYDTDGNLIKQLTDGDWVVKALLGFDPKDSRAYFLATRESPLNRDIYSVDLETKEITMISNIPGTHRAYLNKNGKYLIDSYSDTLVSRRYNVVSHRGKVLQSLFTSENTLEDYMLGDMKIFKLQAENGTDLYCRMILPPYFDPEKKYPAIVYVYGGPHAQLVTNSWLGGAGLFLNYLAQQGTIIFTLDNRGSANRGLEFEQAIFRNLGNLEVADQMTGVQFLKGLPYVDANRIGVNGWSYGGFLTISLMLKHPGDFKAGVCGGPVTDWQYYEVMYGERYMDTPESNPEGYDSANLLNYADQLKGDLLIIHGTDDPTVVWQQSLVLIRKFIEEGIQVDYFVYPGHGHGVGGKDRLHLNRKIEKYFKEHL